MKHIIRYHPLLVALHWVIAALLIAALAWGFLVLAEMPNADPRKLGVLRWHMAAGAPILGLMIIRLIVRWVTSKPRDASTGHSMMDRIAPISHYGFYVLVLSMVGTGFATAFITGLPDIVFGHSGAPLPLTFETYPSRAAHGYLAAVLVALIVLHGLAALYHQFVIKDGLFRRMTFGRRASDPSTPTRS